MIIKEADATMRMTTTITTSLRCSLLDRGGEWAGGVIAIPHLTYLVLQIKILLSTVKLRILPLGRMLSATLCRKTIVPYLLRYHYLTQL
ncbi:MAG: hypothetical protein QXZ17_15995 [Nitrososphaerota archaeon]